MSNVSSDSAGITNYIRKRDFRRVLDREVRAEGYDYFWPNVSVPLGNQPFPNYPSVTEPITLTHQSSRPNGELAIIVGTPTRLFRYFALTNGLYCVGDGTPAGYFPYQGADTPYYAAETGVWIVIGSGFSAQAQRWEAIDIAGLTIFNNGVDLPMTYDVGEDFVRPIYELREQGIAAVGNIATSNGMLLCADIQQINADALTALLSLISSNGITASQAGNYGPSPFSATLIAGTVTAQQSIFQPSSVGQTISFVNGYSAVITQYVSLTQVQIADLTTLITPGLQFFLTNPGTTDNVVVSSAPFFTSAMVGQIISWDSGAVRTIESFVDSQHVIVDANSEIDSGTFSINNPAAYGVYNDQTNIDRIQWRIINSIPFEPRRFAATIPGSISKGTVIINFQYPAVSLNEIIGDQIEVLGAGVNGGNLSATLVYMSPDSMTAIIDTLASTTVTNALVQAFDATGSNVGFIDLQDDGSGIIGMLDLGGNLIVYKDTSIFFGQYTGASGAPFNFSGTSLYRGSKTLYFRNTLISVSNNGQQFHVFAGRTSFYRYDLVYQQPIEIQSLEVCKDIFFDNASLPDSTDPIGTFAADNPITKEIFFCFPESVGQDQALRYDYFTGEASSTTASYTAAAAVKRPETGLQVGVTEDWFIMGTATGQVLRYGLSSADPVKSGAVTITQLGNLITASAPFFTPESVIGWSIQFPDLSVSTVLSYVNPTQITVRSSAARAATSFRLIPSLWHRLGQPYESDIQSGLDDFRNDSGEKDLESWSIAISSKSPSTPFLFTIYGGINPSDDPISLATNTFTDPKVESTVGMLFLQNYFADRITVNGLDNPLEFIERGFNIAGVDSKDFVRR